MGSQTLLPFSHKCKLCFTGEYLGAMWYPHSEFALRKSWSVFTFFSASSRPLYIWLMIFDLSGAEASESQPKNNKYEKQSINLISIKNSKKSENYETINFWHHLRRFCGFVEQQIMNFIVYLIILLNQCKLCIITWMFHVNNTFHLISVQKKYIAWLLWLPFIIRIIWEPSCCHNTRSAR